MGNNPPPVMGKLGPMPPSSAYEEHVQWVTRAAVPPCYSGAAVDEALGPRRVPGRCDRCSGDVRTCDCRAKHRALQVERKKVRQRRKASRR